MGRQGKHASCVRYWKLESQLIALMNADDVA